MTTNEEIAQLESRWKHACEVAFLSIGQDDRAESVAHRDELKAQLEAAKKSRDGR